MTVTIENDILFDDFAAIKSLQGAGRSADAALRYDDCTNNTYVFETAENLSPDCNCSGYTSIEGADYMDCTNNISDCVDNFSR